MICCSMFQFEKLDVDNHWTAFCNFGECISYNQVYFKNRHECKIVLPAGHVYQMGLDQSSTCTGIFIKSYDNTVAWMVEVKREPKQDADDYIFELEMFIHQICDGVTFSHVIYERPIESKAFRSNQVLFQLEGIIRAMSKRYAEFAEAKLDCIENSSWRSVVIDKEVEQKYNRKSATVVSVTNALPWTNSYGPSLNKDNDIYEAIGVLMGWFIVSFDHLGRPYARGDRSSRAVGGYILPGLPADLVVESFKREGVDATLYVENPRYSIYQNLASTVRPYTVTCLEVTSPYTMLCLSVECNIKWMRPDVMTVVLTDAGTADAKLTAIAASHALWLPGRIHLCSSGYTR